MPLELINLDKNIRDKMIDEIEQDIANGKLYMSRRLNTVGQIQYPILLKEAALSHNDAWLAQQIRVKGLLNTEEVSHNRSGETITKKVPITAPDTLAEGEFNRFYCRGLCLYAVEKGISNVRIYRAKEVQNPRPESQAKIGETVNAKQLLDDLRTSQGLDPALKIPPGPNSGLSIQLV